MSNKAIALQNCRNVLLKDFSILKGGHFGLLATGVDNFHIHGLTVDTNRDGIDLDCCRNGHVSECTVNSPWDDAICPKSSYALGFARATENVTVTNCLVSGYDIGSLLDATYKRNVTEAPDKDGATGRIKFGTESNGGFKNITVSNCVFDGCRGLAIESVDGAVIEDVTCSNIASIWPDRPFDVAPTIAFVLNLTRLPDSSASPRAISTPGSSSASRQP